MGTGLHYLDTSFDHGQKWPAYHVSKLAVAATVLVGPGLLFFFVHLGLFSGSTRSDAIGGVVRWSNRS